MRHGAQRCHAYDMMHLRDERERMRCLYADERVQERKI